MRFLDEKTILVAVADPTNVVNLDHLGIALGLEVRLAVATESDIAMALERVHPPSAEEGDLELELDVDEADERRRVPSGASRSSTSAPSETTRPRSSSSTR